MLETLFGPTGTVTWSQECARAIVVFAWGLVLVRLGGRRMFGQWTALDIVVAIVMGSSLSRALTGNADLFGTLAAMTLMVVLHRALANACARWLPLSRLLEGTAVRLAQRGSVDRDAMLRNGVSETGLAQALRGAGLEAAHDAREILLEPSGRITVLKNL